jgi:excisionase family DNA binding protein
MSQRMTTGHRRTDRGHEKVPAALVNVLEGAHHLAISPHTLRAWLRAKRLPHVRLGRRVLLQREDLDRFIRAHTVPAHD